MEMEDKMFGNVPGFDLEKFETKLDAFNRNINKLQTFKWDFIYF